MRPRLRAALVVAAVAVVTAAPDAEAGPPPSLSIAPLPTVDSPDRATAANTPRLSWSTGNASPGLVTVRSPESQRELTVATGPTGLVAVPWALVGREYTFRLYTTSPRRKRLVELSVGKGMQNARNVAVPDDPRNTGVLVDRVLQGLPYGLGLLVLTLTAAYGRELRG